MKQLVTLERSNGTYHIRPAACPTGNQHQCCEAGIEVDTPYGKRFGSVLCCKHTTVKEADISREADGKVYKVCRYEAPDIKKLFNEDDGSSNVD